jgi:mannobiose 2-epimerase
MDKLILSRYAGEVEAELVSNILDFWMRNVIDYDTGSFNGSVSGDGTINPKADKGVLMATRALWTFSRAYKTIPDAEYLKTADLLFNYIDRHFIDKEYGGVYWLLDYSGIPVKTEKKIYGQAFALFGLAEYAKASGNKKALELASDLFDLCEKFGRDHESGGYIESYLRGWEPAPVMKLSSREPDAPKSMNTNLHVMEAYSTFAHHFPDDKIKEALEKEVHSFKNFIVRKAGHLGMFFDMDWKLLSENISYGHDLEASWLLTEAAENTGNKELITESREASILLAETALQEAIDKDGGIICEGDEKGPHIKNFKEWWMQAEAMVGFLNAYQITKKEIFLEKSLSLWEYSKKMLIRPEGEWYFYVGADGITDKTRELAGQWKCPYHTGRACIEVHERLTALNKITNY